MKKMKEWKWWQWALFVILVAGLITAAIIFLPKIDWSPRSRKLDATPITTQSELDKEVLALLVTISANQEELGEQLDALEATPTPTATEVEKEEEEVPASTPTVISTEVVEVFELKTAADIRAFGKVIGWVTGGSEGQFVQGAQVSLKEDWALNTLPFGYVFEYECVHYTVINGEVHATPVCDGGLVRMGTDTIVPKGTVGTLWAPNAITAPLTEEWKEGFLDEPCLCADGDCRDED